MERYDAYKDSGVEWIGEIPAGWKCVNLSAISKQRKHQNKEGNVETVLSLSYGKVKHRILDNSGLLPESFNTYNIIEGGDVVLRLTDLQNNQTSLRVGLCHEEGIITSAYVTLVPISVDSRYLFYCLAVFDYWKGFYGLAGGVRQSLTFDGIRSLRFPLPNKGEQQAIADYLDAKTGEIDGLIADCEREVELLQEYRKSVISEAVTKGLDPTVPMKDSGIEWIGDIPEHWNAGKLLRHARLESGHTPSRLHPEWWLEEKCTIPWITTQDVHRFRDGQITCIDDTELHISQIGLENSSARWLPAGTVALSRTASVGFSIVLSIPMASSQDFADWIPDESLDSFYLLYTLRSMDMIFKQLQMGSTHKTIYMPDIMKLAIAYPPLQEQREIASYLDTKTAEIDALIADKQTMVDKLHEYRKSLISEAVTGKFKVPGA